MHVTDSGEEVVISVDADGHVMDSGHAAKDEGEQSSSMTAEEATIAHYEDFHLFMYGYIPFFIAVAFIIMLCKWFEKTFTRF